MTFSGMKNALICLCIFHETWAPKWSQNRCQNRLVTILGGPRAARDPLWMFSGRKKTEKGCSKKQLPWSYLQDERHAILTVVSVSTVFRVLISILLCLLVFSSVCLSEGELASLLHSETPAAPWWLRPIPKGLETTGWEGQPWGFAQPSRAQF